MGETCGVTSLDKVMLWQVKLVKDNVPSTAQILLPEALRVAVTTTLSPTVLADVAGEIIIEDVAALDVWAKANADNKMSAEIKIFDLLFVIV